MRLLFFLRLGNLTATSACSVEGERGHTAPSPMRGTVPPHPTEVRGTRLFVLVLSTMGCLRTLCPKKGRSPKFAARIGEGERAGFIFPPRVRRQRRGSAAPES